MKFQTIVPSLVLAMYWCDAVYAKQVGEAVTDMGDVGTEDPNGYMLMVISLGILFTCVLSLIGVTTWYMLKGKKQAPKTQEK